MANGDENGFEKLGGETDQFFDTSDPAGGGREQALTGAEREAVESELKKTEEEIGTLRQVLAARQKHAAELKRRLGVTPWTEVASDINSGLHRVKDTQAYQKTTEVASAAAESMRHKWADLRNSSMYKSVESRLGSAMTNARVVASTSIDHLAGHARGNAHGGDDPSAATAPTTPATDGSKTIA